MFSYKRSLCILLASLSLLGAGAVFTGCADPQDSTDTQAPTDTAAAGDEEQETVEIDNRFEGVNYGGREFRIHTSTNVASSGMGNSNFLIEASDTIEGSLVNDAAVARNYAVENLLGIDLVFTQYNLAYTEVPAEVRRLTTSGDDDYDLIINDLFPFAQLSVEGQFRNVLNEACVFDFNRSYWYKDYMEDLILVEGYQNILAGDYFIDVIRSAHLLLLNKDIYRDVYHEEADTLYDTVNNYQWTFAKMNEVITDVYKDTDGNGKDKGDRYGFITPEYWGGSIAYSISGNPGFIERDPDTGDLVTKLATGDRSNQLAAAMSLIFNGDDSSVGLTAESELLTAFANGECLILDYQRLGSLENSILRGMEGDACVLPYPMLQESDQKYTTSSHDTTEVGAILATSKDLAFISTVVEVLNRETANILMPKYYKEGLQVQYVNDSKAAMMIDIIHDNFDNSFALAYSEQLTQGAMLQSFRYAMEEKREFSAVFAGKEKNLNRQLGLLIDAYELKNQDK